MSHPDPLPDPLPDPGAGPADARNGEPRRQRAEVPCEVLDGEAVIWAATTGELVRLNREATLLWQRLAEPASVAELCRVAVAAGCPHDQADADVRATLERLDAQQLLRPVPASG